MLVTAILFAISSRPTSLERELRRDLGIAPNSKLFVIDYQLCDYDDHTREMVVATTSRGSEVRLFAGFRDREKNGTTYAAWHIPRYTVIETDGTKHNGPEWRLTHEPTEAELQRFNGWLQFHGGSIVPCD